MLNIEKYVEAMPRPSLELLTDNSFSMLTEALTVGSYLNLPVVPLRNKDLDEKRKMKAPLVDGGYKSATTDASQISQWWKHQFPGAMIGVPTGQRTSFIVIDIDMKGGKDGFKELAAWEEKYGKLPDTFTAQTINNGVHYYYKIPENVHITSRTNAFGARGIDIVAEGKYVVYANSTAEDGRKYEVIDYSPMADLPAAYLEFLTSEKHSSSSQEPVFVNGVIPDGARNNNLTVMLGSFRGHGMQENDLAKMALILNQQFCRPPLSEDEALKIAESIGKRPRGYSFDNMGNAERYVDRYFGLVKCVERKNWLSWDGVAWRPDTKSSAHEYAKQIARDLDAEAKNLGQSETIDENIQAALSKLAKTTLNNPFSMLPLAATDPKIVIDAKELDQHPFFLNCKNGILDLNTGELLPHDPKYLLTKTANANYVPEARSELWDGFLDFVTEGDKEYQGFLARLYGGLALPADNPEQIMAILAGPGGTGKSKFIGAIKNVLLEFHDVIRQEVLLSRGGKDHRHDVADLKHARFITAVEPPPGSKINGSLMKELTGGDDVKGRKNFAYESEKFKCVGFITLLTNHETEIDMGDSGVRRRLLTIRFDRIVKPDERDADLDKKLAEPDVQDAIMAWLMKGRLKYLEIGLNTPEKVKKFTTDFIEKADPLEGFISKCCELGKDKKIQAEPFFTAFSDYAYREHDHVATSRKFYDALKQKGIKNSGSGGRSYYLGLDLKAEYKKH